MTKYVSKHHICEIKKTTISCTLFSGEDISDGNINSRTLGDVLVELKFVLGCDFLGIVVAIDRFHCQQ